MRLIFLNTTTALLALALLFLSGCKEDQEDPTIPEEQEITDFTCIPKNPTSKDEISVLFQGCDYYQTTSIIIDKNTVDISKHFNSQLKWPCVLVNDTITLGKLRKGDYQVTLEIIDVNPLIEDSVFYSHTETLTVTNK